MSRSTISIAAGGPTYQFLSLKGQVQRIAQTLKDITRPGVDGVAFRTEGQRSKPFTLVGTVDCHDAGDAVAQMQDFAALQGQVVKVIDDYFAEFDSIVVLDATKLEEIPLVAFIGGVNANPSSLLRVQFTLQNFDLAGA